MSQPKPYRPDTLASRWEISATTVRNMCDDGRLPHFKIGKLYRIPAAAVEEYEECQTSPSADSAADTAFHGMKAASAGAINLKHARERKPRQKHGIDT
ncbi:helix-turn-helix domain-containing protein [Sulfitobacter sp. LC.270.F.C4]|uniref:helix-turn-helix domain-containing protein n=1 Tax=Sulfitobacter sp. LC.270.F.C4 TaxID=3079556 RepID=UPI003980BB65